MRQGWIEVVCGPMFAGKTEFLLKQLEETHSHLLFKMEFDNRYSEESVVSHNGVSMPAIMVRTSRAILGHVTEKTDVVGIDEGNFFDEDIVEVCETLADNGIRVIVAGLDMDFRGKPFGSMPHLLAVAETVSKLQAVCACCGRAATRSQRITEETEQVVVGAGEVYEARCRQCWEVAGV